MSRGGVHWGFWPEALKERFWAMVDEGRSAEEIAKTMGITVTAVRARGRREGYIFPPKPVAPKPPQAQTVAPDLVPIVREALAEDPAGMRPIHAGQHKPDTWPLHLAAYVALVELGFQAAAVGRAINRDRKLVTYVVSRIEDRRDDPEFDGFMERLGERAREMAA